MSHLRVPGFVDLQVNGYLGMDFSDPDLNEDTLVGVFRAILASGTVCFLPTVITSQLETYQRNLPLLAKVMQRREFEGRVAGIHLEGPYISPVPGAVGAHQAEWTRLPEIAEFGQLQDWAGGSIRLLTLAAELEGAAELARHASQMGVLVSIGHTLATAADLQTCGAAGASLLTHLGNGLPPNLPKFENPLWAGLVNPDYTAMLIGDGHHIPLPILLAMLRAKGLRRSLIVSDAAPIAGYPPGEYSTLGNPVILTPQGRLYNPIKGNLVGSSFSLMRCMNVLAGSGAFSLEELLWLGREHALHLLALSGQFTEPVLEFDTTTHQFTLIA